MPTEISGRKILDIRQVSLDRHFELFELRDGGITRDVNSRDSILIDFFRFGFNGAVSIAWKDNDENKLAGA